MMKTSVLLGGSFLLSLLFWNSSGFYSTITTTCSEDWLLVRMKRRPYDNETEIRIGDISLGDNCPVTRLMLESYEFSYPVIYCGIKKIVVEGNDVVILSEINYTPVLDVIYEFPVICFVKRRKAPSTLHFGMNGHEAKAMGDGSQGTKEREASSAPSQSTNCEVNFRSINRSACP